MDDWRLAKVALALLAEERYGHNLRRAKAAEDAAAKRAKSAAGGRRGRR